ncbi:hypothetical protein EYF80_021864 [Liparis tanakae]|uniref:Uncharacterized protein n=1 Tax=Liparis tanakae TaxID=230148 RepID=A0A4Z2HRF8_9TELE|nr:hypothetical protein EYF80_021864 [Liparis tanakae]
MDIVLHFLLRMHPVMTLHLQIQPCVDDTIRLCGATLRLPERRKEWPTVAENSPSPRKDESTLHLMLN